MFRWSPRSSGYPWLSGLCPSGTWLTHWTLTYSVYDSLVSTPTLRPLGLIAPTMFPWSPFSSGYPWLSGICVRASDSPNWTLIYSACFGFRPATQNPFVVHLFGAPRSLDPNLFPISSTPWLNPTHIILVRHCPFGNTCSLHGVVLRLTCARTRSDVPVVYPISPTHYQVALSSLGLSIPDSEIIVSA